MFGTKGPYLPYLVSFIEISFCLFSQSCSCSRLKIVGGRTYALFYIVPSERGEGATIEEGGASVRLEPTERTIRSCSVLEQ